MVLTRRTGDKRRRSKTWDIVHEEGREIIQQWRDKRMRLRGARKSYREFLVYWFNFDTLKSFVQNFNIMVLIQIGVAVVSIYLFHSFKISFDIPISFFVSPIVFPLAFSINTDFQRREKVLEDLAIYKSSGMAWYFCMREWKDAAELDVTWMTAVHGKLKSLLFHLHEYLSTHKIERRKTILRVMYEDFSDANQLIEEVRASQLPANSALISRALHLVNMMCLSFERLRVIREYRSPRSIRSFNKVFIMLLPIILAPYFVHLGLKDKDNNTWQPYYIAVFVTFVFSALQGVQDKLDDPFDGMSEDDINLDTIDEWTSGSLEHTMEREFNIVRFKVTVDPKNDPKEVRFAKYGIEKDMGKGPAQKKCTQSSPFPKAKTKHCITLKEEAIGYHLYDPVLEEMKSDSLISKGSMDRTISTINGDNSLQCNNNHIFATVFEPVDVIKVARSHAEPEEVRDVVVFRSETVTSEDIENGTEYLCGEDNDSKDVQISESPENTKPVDYIQQHEYIKDSNVICRDYLTADDNKKNISDLYLDTKQSLVNVITSVAHMEDEINKSSVNADKIGHDSDRKKYVGKSQLEGEIQNISLDISKLSHSKYVDSVSSVEGSKPSSDALRNDVTTDDNRFHDISVNDGNGSCLGSIKNNKGLLGFLGGIRNKSNVPSPNITDNVYVNKINISDE